MFYILVFECFIVLFHQHRCGLDFDSVEKHVRQRKVERHIY